MSDLGFHVRTYVPTAAGEELEHRVALLKARDWAAALRGRTQCLQAFNLAAEAHELAGAYVFATEVNESRLQPVVRLCRHLVAAAMLAEQIELSEAANG